MLKNSRGRLTEYWASLTGKQQAGAAFAVAAIVMTLGLAILKSVWAGAPSGLIVILAVVGILSQIASALWFGQVGKADPSHAEASVMNLVQLGANAGRWRSEVETLLEKRNPKAGLAEMREAMTKLSVALSSLEDSAVRAIEHWRLFHEQAADRAKAQPDKDEVDGETE